MINFNKQIWNLYGVGMSDELGNPLTLGKLAAECIVNDCSEKTSSSEKMTRYHLARQVIKGGEFELNPEFITMIKESISKFHNPVVVGSAFEIIGD